MRLFELSEYEPVGFGSKDAGYHDIERMEVASKVAHFIRENCQSWFSQSAEGTLHAYRGFAKTPQHKLAFKRTVRQERTPRDSTYKRHVEFNNFIQRCGKVANRTNSVFVTTNRHHAAYFGEVYIVFPVGNFHYTWLPGIEDWTENIVEIESFWPQELKGDDGTLAEGLRRGAEIMINCQEIVAVDPYFYKTQVSSLI